MLNQNKGMLTCFLMFKKDNIHRLYAIYYNINDNNIYYNTDTNYNPKHSSYETDDDIECIKSVLDPSRSKALVSLYRESGIMTSFIYYFNSFFSYRRNQFFNNSYCMQNYFGLQVYHFKSNNEYINSCLDVDGNLLIELYGENLNLYFYAKISKKKLANNGYSILYSNYTDNYFFISQEEPFNLLFEDNEELENIRNNFHIEDYLYHTDIQEEDSKTDQKIDKKEEEESKNKFEKESELIEEESEDKTEKYKEKEESETKKDEKPENEEMQSETDEEELI